MSHTAQPSPAKSKRHNFKKLQEKNIEVQKPSGYLNYKEKSPVCPGLRCCADKTSMGFPEKATQASGGGGSFRNGKSPQKLWEKSSKKKSNFAWRKGWLSRVPPKGRKARETGNGTHQDTSVYFQKLIFPSPPGVLHLGYSHDCCNGEEDLMPQLSSPQNKVTSLKQMVLWGN